MDIWSGLYSKVCFFTCSHACRPLSGEITQKPAPNPHARSPSFWRCRRSWKDASRLRDTTQRATHASQVRRFRELQETAKIFAHAKIQRMTKVFAARAKILSEWPKLTQPRRAQPWPAPYLSAPTGRTASIDNRVIDRWRK